MKNFLLLICVILSINEIWAIDDNYPKSKQERQADEIGSIVGDEGIIFRPNRIKNESTKAVISPGINKYLWQASIEVLDADFIPLASVDSPTGIIITDWYNPKDSHQGKSKLNYNRKVNILIKDNVIAPSAIEIKAYERERKNSKWMQVADNSNIANELEEKIIRRAREIYIKEIHAKAEAK